MREDAYDMITVMSQDWKLAELKQVNRILEWDE